MTRAIICASWPAPLAIRIVPSPSPRAVASIRPAIPPSASAGSLRPRRIISILNPLSPAIASTRFRIFAPSASSFALDKSRISTSSLASPGTTFAAFGFTSSYPTVPTCSPGSLITISRTASVTCAAATRASLRSAMGVVPAWFASPRTTTS